MSISVFIIEFRKNPNSLCTGRFLLSTKCPTPKLKKRLENPQAPQGMVLKIVCSTTLCFLMLKDDKTSKIVKISAKINFSRAFLLFVGNSANLEEQEVL